LEAMAINYPLNIQVELSNTANGDGFSDINGETR
jgi:hypothetical protein